jgi:hypothetical protein
MVNVAGKPIRIGGQPLQKRLAPGDNPRLIASRLAKIAWQALQPSEADAFHAWRYPRSRDKYFI